MASLATIESACELVTDGTHYTPKDVGEGVPFLTVKDVSDSGLDFVGCSYITDSDYLDAALGNSAPKKGDVLFSKDGTVGKVHVVTSDKPFAVLSSLAILRPKKDCVDPRYLGHALRSPDTLNEALKKKTGSAIRRIILSDLKRVKIFLPPLPEQRRIAAILDQADALRTKRREALAQLDSLTQSIFIEMFGDPLLNPMSFPVRTLKQLGKVKTGGTPPSAKDGMFGGSIPFITPGDLNSNKPAKRTVTELGAAAAETVRSGSALVCCIGATIGKMAKAKNNSAFNQQINAVEWSGAVDDDYGVNVLKFFKSQIMAEGASTTLPILKKSSFEKIAIPVPSIDLQNAFSKKVQALESLKESYRCSSTELDTLFASLQHRAFQGEL